MIKCIEKDRLLLHRDTIDALAFGIIAGESDTFRVVPENVALVCELFDQIFPC